MPPVEEWETFPFDGDMRPRALLPPAPIDIWRENLRRVVDAVKADPPLG
jgi:hypothetical protein